MISGVFCHWKMTCNFSDNIVEFVVFTEIICEHSFKFHKAVAVFVKTCYNLYNFLSDKNKDNRSGK